MDLRICNDYVDTRVGPRCARSVEWSHYLRLCGTSYDQVMQVEEGMSDPDASFSEIPEIC